MPTPIDPMIFGPDQQCFGCGPTNATGMQLQFERDGDEVFTTFRARDGWEGPPGIVHGGLQSTLADEIGAWTLVGLRNRFGFTMTMNLRLYRPAKLSEPIEARGRIVEEDDTTATVQVTLRQGGRRVLSGRIRYAIPTKALAEKMLERSLPESWLSMCRPE